MSAVAVAAEQRYHGLRAAVVARLIVERALDLSEGELSRCISGVVAPTVCFWVARKMRSDGWTLEDVAAEYGAAYPVPPDDDDERAPACDPWGCGVGCPCGRADDVSAETRNAPL